LLLGAGKNIFENRGFFSPVNLRREF